MRHVAAAIEARQQQCFSLLSELTPRLQAARRVERELDRLLAHRFNAFDYLRTDELGLSRIIADLLDPTAGHGQGTLFLRAMLESLPETRELAESIRPIATDPVKVVTERQTPTGRRIDVSVDIPTEEGTFCLAFENKPYAEDQPKQISDYLKFLGNHKDYRGRFLLIYLPPYDRDPPEFSLSAPDREKWRDHFRVMPYAEGSVTLQDWFKTCRHRCEVERLNWFLREAQTFCRQRFGILTMTSDAESREIREYLHANPSQFGAALAIYDAWPLIRDEACETFLRQLRGKLETELEKALPGFVGRLNVRHSYGGEKRYSNLLFVGLNDKPQYEIGIQSHAQRGPNGWLKGVRAPKIYSEMTASERSICGEVSAALKLAGLSLAIVKDPPYLWPQYEYLQRNQDWDPLTPELHAESESGGGPITDYFVTEMLDIATKAVPAIAGLESE